MDAHRLEYDLPENRIAQAPPEERDAGRLLVLDKDGMLLDRAVLELPNLLPPSLFVFNDTRVIPARLRGTKQRTGGNVELLLVERRTRQGVTERWVSMARASKGLRQGICVDMDGLTATVTDVLGGGFYEVELALAATAHGGARASLATVSERIQQCGEMPLPPYVQRPANESDRERYQTVFAHHLGAVAAPTAGLHFSSSLMADLEAAGHRIAYITLHVGPGTFLPLRVNHLAEHTMHGEHYVVPPDTVAAVDSARDDGMQVVAVGTTAVRTLETVAEAHGRIRVERGATHLFVYPPYEFKVVDHLVTNFHLPKSTLLALVMAFGAEEQVRAAYLHAVREHYRFYSYGDAMLLRGSGGMR